MRQAAVPHSPEYGHDPRATMRFILQDSPEKRLFC